MQDNTGSLAFATQGESPLHCVDNVDYHSNSPVDFHLLGFDLALHGVPANIISSDENNNNTEPEDTFITIFN